MRPRPALLLGALIAPALPMLVAAPASAAGTICVGPVPQGTACTTTQPTIPAAIASAGSPPTLIRVGPGTYADGPYVLPPGVSIQGSGAGTNPANATVLRLPAGSQTYLTAGAGSTVSDLRVEMPTGNGATGIAAGSGSSVDNVVVYAVGSTSSVGISAQGAQVRDATVNMTGSATGTGVRSLGGNLLVSQSTWNGGGSGYVLAAAADSTTDSLRRVTVNGEGVAVSVQRGVLNIDNSVIDLGATGTTGVQARPADGASATVNATYLTVVRGAAGSRGVAADASGSGTRTASVSLVSSIVRGPTTSLVRDPGAGSSAASFSVTTSNYQNETGGVPTSPTNLVGADPLFVDAAGDYRLRATSPVVDKGVVVPAAGDLDRSGAGRSFDGDRNGIPVPDMGAYELRDVTAPGTTFTSGPAGATNDNTPVFQFRSEAGARFECRVDAGAWQPCTSPATTPPLADGSHSFQVRALDEVFNVEDPPVVRTFTVDTVVPNATITKKPPKRFFKKRVKFKFATSEPGARLQCNLDGRGWRGCQATYRFNTKVGKHVMLVRAVDAAGNVDPSPARYKYKRLARRR